MKAHLDIQHTGTLDSADRTRMTINPEDFTHIMSVVTDLYSNPEAAVWREYATNALDSHRAAGNSAPIEIDLPTAISPLYVVTDHGVGMSVDDIINIFGKYGRSTKRNSDTEVGMLGLGCKSALTYTSQFTLISVHDGVRVTVLVTREDDGAGAIQIIDTAGTDEPNGVSVQIPVKNIYTFTTGAMNFFRFWERGTVLVNGAEPDYFGTHYLDRVLEDDTVIVTTRVSQDHIIMGNVPYPLPWGTDPLIPERSSNNLHAIVRVPIGAVDFAPSREALRMTNRTKEILHEATQFITHTLYETACREIDAAPTHLAAMQLAEEWTARYKGIYRYRGELIPGHITIDRHSTYRWRISPARSNAGSRPGSNYINVSDAVKAWHVYGFNLQTFPATTKQRLALYAEEHDLEPEVVFLHAQQVGSPWLDDLTWVSYDAIKAIKLPKTDRPEGKYRIMRYTSGIREVDSVDFTKLVWISAKDSQRHVPLHLLPTDYFAIVLRANQIAKFRREHPEVLSLDEWVKAEAERFLADLTPAGRYWLKVHSTMRHHPLLKLNPKHVNDPEVKIFVKAMLRFRTDTSFVQTWNRFRDAGAPLGNTVEHEQLFASILRRYPLLSRIGDGNQHECTEYINAMHMIHSGLHLSRAY